MRFDDHDDIMQITPRWTGERFPDGRPRVPDSILRRVRKITLEEAWAPLYGLGYKYQFEGDLKFHIKTKNLLGAQ